MQKSGGKQSYFFPPDHMTFRIKAKQIFLTYSQVNNVFDNKLCETPEHYREFAEQTLGRLLCARIGRELHQDGGIHYHMFLGFSEAATINSSSIMDYEGQHPNIKSVRRDPGKVWDYAGKDGDIKLQYGELGDMGVGEGRGTSTKRGRDELYSEALDEPTKDGFLSKIRALAPRDYVVCHGNIRAYADWAYRPELPEYGSPTFNFSNGVEELRDTLLAWSNGNINSTLSGRR